MSVRRRAPRPRSLGAAVVAASVGFALGAGAQSPETLRDRCVQAGGATAACTDVAVGARAVAGQIGLLTGWGSEVPGSSSTLGRKIGNSPRVSLSVRAGAMSIGLPDLFYEGVGPAPSVSFLVPAVHAALALGLLDGFSPLPTVGGVFSLDLLGSLGIVMPPSSQGFRGSATGGSVGGRLGLLRESFTLPGVSLSFTHRFVGGAALGDPTLGDPASITVDPEVTSLRVTVGKDLFGVGVLAGWGWDDTSTDAVVTVARVGPSPATAAAKVGGKRHMYFGGLALNFLLLQLSAEGGWAQGYAMLPAAGGSAFDAEGGSAFGSLALRFTP